MARLLLATLGSLGDLNPALALARAFVAAGHTVRLAANPMHAEATRRRGMAFVPIGLHADPTEHTADAAPADIGSDALAFVERANFSQLDALAEDLWQASTDAEMVIAPFHVVPAHVVAAKRGIPFLAYTLSPAYLVQQTRMLGANRAVASPPTHWHAALAQLRRRFGLPARPFPYAAVFTDPVRMLGLFPAFLLDAPAGAGKLKVVGYPRDDAGGTEEAAADAGLRAFCDEHTVVFSFGSFVDRIDPRALFEQSVAACRALGLKCLYLSRYVDAALGAHDVMVRRFVDHAAVFPHAGAIVHHGGLGTLMAASAAAKPMVTVPFHYDQPYPGERMAQLVDAPVLPAERYNRDTVQAALARALRCADTMRTRLTKLMAQESDGAPAAVREVAALLQPEACSPA